MKSAATVGHHPFIMGGGAMGELTRNHPWETSPLGTPDQWPQSLRTTLGILLHSSFPMFLFWGPDLICFYNDAFRPSLGVDGKHPSIGKRGKEVWPEIWDFIGPLIEQVRTTGTPVYFEDQYVPFYRNGTIEDIYWTFSYSPAYGDDGKINGVFVTCTETTEKVNLVKHLAESKNQLAFAIDAGELATWDFNPLTNTFIGNARYTDWFGLPADVEVDNQLALNTIAEEDRDRVIRAYLDALDYETGSKYDIEFTIRPTGKPERIVRAKGKAWFNDEKMAYRFTGTLQDVTEQVRSRRRVALSEYRFRSLIEESPVATCLFVGRDMVIEVANETMIRYWGKGASVIGKKFGDAVPELEGQPFLNILDDVYTTGKSYEARAAKAKLVIDGTLSDYYFDYTYTPLFDEKGNVYGIMDTAIDVTEQVLAKKRLEESERNLRNLIVQAPVGICIVSGANMYVEVVNDMFLEIVRRQRHELEHMPYWESLAEAAAFYQPILKDVFNTGISYKGEEHSVLLLRNGSPETVYISFVYEPIKEVDGTVAKVMIVALDVTQQVLSRKKVEEAEERARLSTSAADLGTYELNIETDELLVSPRLKEIFGVDNDADHNRYLASLYPEDLKIRKLAFEEAYRTGNLEYEARVLNKDGSLRWIRSKGRVIFNEQNKPVRVLGVTQDITEQKIFEEELNKQVTQRTRELQNLNAELQRSNANLEEFAHAASHDLKEPIRKIHFFTDRLKIQLAERLQEDEKATFARVEKATLRMSALIDDLLLYSHVSLRPHEKEEVDLQEKVTKVLEDLELDILEKKASVQVEPLPVVKGYRRQLQQLFQNLISNALKYSKQDTPPEVKLTCQKLSGKDLPGFDPDKEVYLLEVSDNGIGFDPKESERIFQMFQRLHGNKEYSGSGVGLSIAKKVVENHNGRIIAESQPGKGSKFKVYLPV